MLEVRLFRFGNSTATVAPVTGARSVIHPAGDGEAGSSYDTMRSFGAFLLPSSTESRNGSPQWLNSGRPPYPTSQRALVNARRRSRWISMNRRTMIGGAAALAAVPAGIGTLGVFGDFWRTDDEREVRGADEGGHRNDEDHGGECVTGALRGHQAVQPGPGSRLRQPWPCPLPDVMHTPCSRTWRIRRSLERINDPHAPGRGSSRSRGDWTIHSRYPGTEGIDGGILIGFKADGMASSRDPSTTRTSEGTWGSAHG